jgi:hypothetical protein
VPGAEERGVPNTARVPSVRQTKSGIDNFNVKVLKDCFETIGDIINHIWCCARPMDGWMGEVASNLCTRATIWA